MHHDHPIPLSAGMPCKPWEQEEGGSSLCKVECAARLYWLLVVRTNSLHVLWPRQSIFDGCVDCTGGPAFFQRQFLVTNWVSHLSFKAVSKPWEREHFHDRGVAGLLTHWACQRHCSAFHSTEGEGDGGTAKIGWEIRSPTASGHQSGVAEIFMMLFAHTERKERKDSLCNSPNFIQMPDLKLLVSWRRFKNWLVLIWPVLVCHLRSAPCCFCSGVWGVLHSICNVVRFVRCRCPLLRQEVYPPLIPCWGSIIVMFVAKFRLELYLPWCCVACSAWHIPCQWNHFSLEQGTSPDTAPFFFNCGAPSCGQQDHTAASTLKNKNH